jgi:hypothetical protein
MFFKLEKVADTNVFKPCSFMYTSMEFLCKRALFSPAGPAMTAFKPIPLLCCFNRSIFLANSAFGPRPLPSLPAHRAAAQARSPHLTLACDPIDGLACGNLGPAMTESCLPVAVSSRSDSRTGVHLESCTPGQDKANWYSPVHTGTYQYMTVHDST